MRIQRSVCSCRRSHEKSGRRVLRRARRRFEHLRMERDDHRAARYAVVSISVPFLRFKGGNFMLSLRSGVLIVLGFDRICFDCVGVL